MAMEEITVKVRDLKMGDVKKGFAEKYPIPLIQNPEDPEGPLIPIEGFTTTRLTDGSS